MFKFAGKLTNAAKMQVEMLSDF